MCKHSKAVCVHNNLRFAKTYSITMWDTVQSQVTRLRLFPWEETLIMARPRKVFQCL